MNHSKPTAATGRIVVRPTRRGDTYYAKLRLPTGDTMRRLGRVWDKRSRPPAGYLTRTQAEQLVEDMLAGRDRSVRVVPVDVTFGQLVDEWLADRGRSASASTMYDYRNVAEARLKPLLGADTPADELTVAQLGVFRDQLLDEGLAARTVNKYLTLVHGIYRLAGEAHGLGFNPAAMVRRPKQRRRGLDQYLTPEEVGVLVRAAETVEEAVLYEVACWTGLRFGELRALRWVDIDWTGGAVQVVRNWPVKGEEKLPKSGQVRPVPLWDTAAAALERLSRRGYQVADDDYVFVDPRGDEVLDYDAVAQRRFKATRDRAGLTSPRPGDAELRFHDLRHTFGTVAARIYGDLGEVQRYLGHASITTTEIYAHFLPRLDAARRGSEGLAALLAEGDSVPRAVPRTGEK